MNAPRAINTDPLRDSARRQWSGQQTLAARHKWRARHDAFTQAATQVILEALAPRPSLHLLDLASGMGEPALSLAAAVGPSGHVTATDIEPEALAVAQEDALSRGLSNLGIRLADAESLPFRDATFDGVTCRFGIMFFADPAKALRECLRALKPGARAVFLAWGSAEQPFVATTGGILAKHASVSPDPAAPNPFRYAEPGTLRRALEEASFIQVQEEQRTIPLVWAGPPAEFWEAFSQMAAPYQPLLQSLPPERRAQVDCEIAAAIGKYYDGERVTFPGLVVLGTGVRG